MYKIIDGDGNVYIPLSELEKKGINIEIIPSSVVVPRAFSEPVISEKDFNVFLKKDPDSMVKYGSIFSVTKVNTLEMIVKDEEKIRPIKKTFLMNVFNGDREAVEKKIEHDMEAAVLEGVGSLTRIKYLSAEYRLKANILKENSKEIHAIAEKNDISFQMFTSFRRYPSFSGFICGKGIFYGVSIDKWTMKDFREIKRKKNGNLVFPNKLSGGNKTVKKKDIVSDRDFRKHGVFENIRWILKNMEIKNDFGNMVSVDEGGINLNVPLELIMRMINPGYKEVVYCDGIVPITEKAFSTEFPFE